MSLLKKSALRFKSIDLDLDTYRRLIVPERNIILAPLETSMKLLGRCNDICKIPDDGITLSLRNANDLSDKTRVEEQRIPPSDGVGPDQRMLGCDRLSTHWSSDCP